VPSLLTMRRILLWSALGCGLVASASGQAAADSTVPVVPVVVMPLALRGVGELRFGERLQWRLVIEPPADMRPGEGVRLGGVSVRDTAGKVRHALPEPPAYSRGENGGSCEVIRVDVHAIIRCGRDYVFNTATGAAPVWITPQFRDRVAPSREWLEQLPLPWWQPTGERVAGTTLIFLRYGYVNYGQLIESTDVFRGPALLDLGTGKIAVARLGVEADSPMYDASIAPETEPVADHAEAIIADETRDGRRVVTVMTVFDRCVGARCGGDDDAGFRRRQPLSYVFD
jgi:hypothetical protein